MPAIKLSSKHIRLLALLSPVLLAALALTLWYETEVSRPWKAYQRGFTELDRQLTDQEQQAAAQQPDSPEKTELLAMLDQRGEGIDCRRTAIRQLWLTDFNLVDRCLTCHQGVESSRFDQSPQPFTSHPGPHLAANRHPVEKFGCVVCHDGQGVALTTETAHGETDIWLHPILRHELAEASCRRCHAYDDAIPNQIAFPDAPHLTRGKQLYLEKECMGCHLLKGFERPGRIGPILTRVGEKVQPDWLGRWISRPRQYLPKTIMPFFDLQPEQVDKLGAYLTGLVRETQATEALSGSAQQGRQLFEETGCLVCHALGETGGDFGPALDRVAEKLIDPGWLLHWIKQPTAYDPETEMPNFRLAPDQIQDLAAYLLTLRQGQPEPVHFEAGLAEEGGRLFTTLGCTGCHKVENLPYGFPGSPEHSGFADKPMEMFDFGHLDHLSEEMRAHLRRTRGDDYDLDALARELKSMPRSRAAWTFQKLSNPRIYSTETIRLVMPDFGLGPEEIRDLRVFLFSLKEDRLPEEYQLALWDKADPFLQGMRTVEKYNCTGCHKMGLQAREMELDDEFPEGYFWAASTYATDDISQGDRLLYPRGSELTEEQTAGLLALDPELGNSLFFRRWFVDYDTVGYLMDMGLKKIKVLGMEEGDIMGLYKDLNFAPPILHYQGVKVQPNWLYGFLDNPYPIRPLTKATMPTFNFSQDEIAGLVAFFAAKDGLAGNPYFALEELTSDQADKAEGVFKICLQCHVFDQERIQDKARFGDLKGPNMAEIKRRLRPEYIRQWVKFPDVVIPGTQMKNFFYDFDIDNRFEEIDPDETGITDISQEEKIEMMARFLMNPFKKARLSVQR